MTHGHASSAQSSRASSSYQVSEGDTTSEVRSNPEVQNGAYHLVCLVLLLTEAAGGDALVDVKRRPGRPRGITSLRYPNPKRPVGRPRGSGPKQLAAATHALEVQTKRPVGRPRKAVSAQDKPVCLLASFSVF
jgi:hypothetical protein